MYEDLFFAIKKFLLTRVSRETALFIATNVTERIKQRNLSKDEVIKLRNVFLEA